jgi:glycosyltransferase involved in cell wall biosynthesis
MPAITALLHTQNDALRLGRALETLFVCDEILIVDHHSHDATCRAARQHGARIVPAFNHASPEHYLHLASYDWILCLQPSEAISDGLQTSLYEWKSPPVAGAAPFSFLVREETASGWHDHTVPETRLIPRNWKRWQGTFPIYEPSAFALQGELLRFALP